MLGCARPQSPSWVNLKNCRHSSTTVRTVGKTDFKFKFIEFIEQHEPHNSSADSTMLIQRAGALESVSRIQNPNLDEIRANDLLAILNLGG